MKKYFQNLIAVCALTVLTGLSSQAQTVTGSYVPTVQQSQTQWCWAACSEMIYWAYKPGTVSQCAVVNKCKELETSWWGIGGCNNISHSSTSACSSPATFNSPQAMYGCNGSLQSILDSYGIPSTSYASSLSGATLTSNLSGKKLMIARWGWNNGGGHFIVVNRYKNGYVYFNNPGNNSANVWTYNTFKTANGSGNWTHTLRMNNASVYGSTYYKPIEQPATTEMAVEALSVNMYPNPATEKVNIILNGEISGTHPLTITDAVGKIVYTQNYTSSTPSVSVDVAGWSRGVYFVNIGHDKKLSKTLSLR